MLTTNNTLHQFISEFFVPLFQNKSSCKTFHVKIPLFSFEIWKGLLRKLQVEAQLDNISEIYIFFQSFIIIVVCILSAACTAFPHYCMTHEQQQLLTRCCVPSFSALLMTGYSCASLQEMISFHICRHWKSGKYQLGLCKNGC